ncbi:unnamed protein product [Fusarium equiseti]|uniref:DNA2/NAM7 helicase-like C-terminal domain-containing protein n=1 Tax=Fusarium equiseti TaxID=61235 RepID=A0A8J2ILR2_FUSEQ|nr:unnamed protein product [Fusarium equiseti]
MLHLSCYAHGIGVDSKRLAHLTVFVKDVIQASANEHPNPETSLAEYCAEAKTFGDISTVLSVTTKAAFLRIAQGTSHMLIDISRGERPLSQLKLLQENVYPTGSSTEESSLEITLVLSPEQHDYAVRFVKIINDRKEKKIQSDPLAPYFLHAPDARTLTVGQAPAPGSEGFPTNHLLHNISRLLWEQTIQERKTAGLAEQAFRAVVVRTPHVNKNMLVVKVGGREDLYPQSGDPCQVSIEGTTFPKSSDEHDIAASAVYKALKDAEPQYDRLVYFNKNCEYVVVDPSPDAGSNNASDHTFRGHCVDCIDLGIPRGYRTMIITHPKIEGAPAPKVGLPYTTLRNEETIAQYVERVDEHELVEVTIKTAISQKTIKTQSFAMNTVGDILRIGSQSSQASVTLSQPRQVPVTSRMTIIPSHWQILVLGVDETSGSPFIANKNRICVGITRRIGALFVIGDVKTAPEVMTAVDKKKNSLRKSDDLESESVKSDVFWMMLNWFRQAWGGLIQTLGVLMTLLVWSLNQRTSIAKTISNEGYLSILLQTLGQIFQPRT